MKLWDIAEKHVTPKNVANFTSWGLFIIGAAGTIVLFIQLLNILEFFNIYSISLSPGIRIFLWSSTTYMVAFYCMVIGLFTSYVMHRAAKHSEGRGWNFPRKMETLPQNA